jgi:hypothetical protein
LHLAVAFSSSINRRPIWLRHQTDQGLGAVDVGRRTPRVRLTGAGADEISDVPIASVCHLQNHGIAVEAQGMTWLSRTRPSIRYRIC